MIKKLKEFKTPIILSILLVFYFLILVFLTYTGVIKITSVGLINFVFIAIMLFIGGITKGKKASKQGYLEGLKLGLIVLLVLFILNLVFYRCFNLYIFLYYILIVSSSTIGSMIGINTKH